MPAAVVSRLDAHPVHRLDDRNLRRATEQFRQEALVVRREVLHEDVDKPGIRRQSMQKPCEGVEPTRRSSDADDRREVSLGVGGVRAARRR